MSIDTNMIKCCANCSYLRELWWWKNYPKDKQYGNCCVALEPEGAVMQLYGDVESEDNFCEMWRYIDDKG